MITYKWTISAFDCKAILEDLTDVVYNVHWRYEATKKDILVSTYGVLTLEKPNKDNFISLNDLTENEVISWCESKLNINELNILLENKIILKENPTEIRVKEPFKNKK